MNTNLVLRKRKTHHYDALLFLSHLFMTYNSNDDCAVHIKDAFELYGHTLFRHCCYRNFSREDAEEIVQETFLNAWQFLKSGKDIENPKAFLFRIANNLIVDKVRKRKKETSISLDALQEQGFDVEEQKNETQIMGNKLEAEKMLKQLKKHMNKEEQQLLHMRFIRGLMPADIAAEMNASSNTISVRLHRALKKFTSFLDSKNV